jgi:rubrerythrin
MATTYQLLDKAERLELLAGQVYQELAARHQGQARALFERLSEEEKQHATRVRLLKARYLQDPRLLTVNTADSLLIDRLIQEAEAIAQEIRDGAWDGDVATVLRRAAELEDRFSVAHANVLSQDGIPGLRAFFDQLAAQDRGHRELLNALESSGLPPP